jgi:hypothetical protein
VKRCDDINSENKPRLVRQEGLNHFMADNPSKKKKEAEASPIMMSPKDHPIGSCFPLPGSPPGGSAFPSAAGTDVPDGPRHAGHRHLLALEPAGQLLPDRDQVPERTVQLLHPVDRSHHFIQPLVQIAHETAEIPHRSHPSFPASMEGVSSTAYADGR